MTDSEISERLYRAFRALYPSSTTIIVQGVGSDEIQASIQHGTKYIQHFNCVIPSDDDGFFYFHLSDHDDVIVRIPYPI